MQSGLSHTNVSALSTTWLTAKFLGLSGESANLQLLYLKYYIVKLLSSII